MTHSSYILILFSPHEALYNGLAKSLWILFTFSCLHNLIKLMTVQVCVSQEMHSEAVESEV